MDRLNILQEHVEDITPIIDALEAFCARHGVTEGISAAKHALEKERAFWVHRANELANEESKRIVESAEKVAAAIRAVHPGIPDHFINDSMPCPCCEKGELFYRISDNGHIGARCNQNGCVNFQE